VDVDYDHYHQHDEGSEFILYMKHQSGVVRLKKSREKWRKCISVTGSLRGQAQVRPIDKLDETCTNADDWMMLVQHHSGDRLMS